jgi:hypothetical protein
MGADAKVSFYNSAKDVAPSREITAREVVRIIHDGDHAEAVASVRAATTEDEKRAAKMKLPAVQISGCVIKGRRKDALKEGRFEHSGWLQLDLDADDLNSSSPQEARAILGADPHVLSAFLSPSGEGAKALFRIKPCRSDAEHKAEFLAVAKYIFKTYGFKIDPATKDAGRLCYLSADAECTWNGAPVEFVAPVEIAELTRIKAAEPLVIREKAFPEPPRKGIHSWLMEAAWHCRLHEGMTEAETVAKLKSYDGSLRRPLQPTEATDAARAVFSQPLDGVTARQTPAEPLSPDKFAAMLAERMFNFDECPVKPIPIFELCGNSLCTAGNIMNIQALPKAGKSAVVESKIAAIFNGNRQGPDTLGFRSENALGHAVVHFDTEQSRYDHDALVRRAVRRARVERTPEWFLSYSVADLDIKERRQALRHVMHEAKVNHTGIFAVFIDGVGDLAADPNDTAEAFELVQELHTLAITHECVIITVLHENPGSETGKTRGHLGSQIERKAETNLRLAKDKDGVTTMWAEKARHCYLPKEQGPCFSWNDQEQMHTSCGTAGEIKTAANRAKMEEEAELAFDGEGLIRHTELMAAIGKALDLKEGAQKTRIKKWAAEGVIQKDKSGNYRLANP